MEKYQNNKELMKKFDELIYNLRKNIVIDKNTEKLLMIAFITGYKFGVGNPQLLEV